MNRLFYPVLFIISFVFLGYSLAANKKNNPNVNKREPASFKYVISSIEWMELMSRSLPAAFCDSKEYYGFCFESDFSTCGSMVEKIARSCYRKISIPKNVRLSTQGVDLGQVLGRCVGGEFEKQMSAKRKNTSVCKESRQWF
ncbi:MAG: hypothetical protein A4S09_02705 [Proteobacteria bacterium SG_bin7]|nr:MAG: hypothetical protein A4S09_02705 [Proteobacteria bacterium SG_bin7]